MAAAYGNIHPGAHPSHRGRVKALAVAGRSSKGMNLDLIALTQERHWGIERADEPLGGVLEFRPFTQWRDPYPVRVDTQW
ncbi:hypothetical protein [Streptomyces sp. NBC_01601]|uniref:hypothetical protein n=1 Tax=Streptomyces sp. NBC_01601 TaxID=2975892 RepID=UPI002E2A68FA|nr:hypothetical protein [Streptomyces sp. NBC_01601]